MFLLYIFSLIFKMSGVICIWKSVTTFPGLPPLVVFFSEEITKLENSYNGTSTSSSTLSDRQIIESLRAQLTEKDQQLAKINLQRELTKKDEQLAKMNQQLAKMDQQLAKIDQRYENEAVLCGIYRGKEINEGIFKFIKQRKSTTRRRTRNQMKRATPDTAGQMGKNLIPEDLSAYKADDLIKKSKSSFYKHWVPFFDTPTNNSKLLRLRDLLAVNGTTPYEFGWSMAKSFFQFCAYVSRPRSTNSIKLRWRLRDFESFPEMIRKYTHWIVTLKDLANLNLAASFMNEMGIAEFVWYNETKGLAIPRTGENFEDRYYCVIRLEEERMRQKDARGPIFNLPTS